MRHRFRTLGRWLALASMAGTATVGLAPPAGAYNPPAGAPTISVVNCTAAAAGAVAPDAVDIPTVAFGATNQPAGCWALQPDPGEAWQNGDVVQITVDDFGGNPTAGTVKFSAPPTVKIGGVTQTNVSAAGSTLTVGVTGLGPNGMFADMVITGVRYTVDAKAAPTAYGPVRVTMATVNGNPLPGGPPYPANAYVSDVAVSANNPPVGIDWFPNPGTVSVSNVVLKETPDKTAFPPGQTHVLCVSPVAGNFNFTGFSASNVAVTGDASITSAGIDVDGQSIEIQFTEPASRSQANTFTLSGVTMNVAGPGIVMRAEVRLFTNTNAAAVNCGGGTPTLLSPDTTVGALVDQQRTFGSDRYQTARQIANQVGPADIAVIARGDDFADALAASALAGHLVTTVNNVVNNVPILLTQTNAIPSATLAAIQSLQISTVYIVGGTAAVSSGVENQLKNTLTADQTEGVACPTNSNNRCLKVTRIAGANRYATAQEIASAIGTAGTVDLDKSDGLGNANQQLKTVFLARGDVFADALAAGPLAYQGTNNVGPSGDGNPIPILLTTPNALSPEADAALIDTGAQQVVILGGTQAVSAAVESALTAKGLKVIRIAGTNRQETAARLAQIAIDPGLFGFPLPPCVPPPVPAPGCRVILASGANFPDALAAGPLGGRLLAPIVLTEDADNIGLSTQGMLDLTTANVFQTLHIVGGPLAVSDNAATQARNALSGTNLALAI